MPRGKCRRGIVLALVAFGGAASLGAESLPARRFTHFSIDTWSIRSGALPSAVRSITQTPDGYLWVLTSAGPLKFDGVRFTPSAELEDVLGARLRQTNAMLRGRDGTLWLAGLDFLAELKDGRARVHDRILIAACLAEGADGAIWIGRHGHGLARFKDGRFTEEPAPGPSVNALHVDARGTLWVGSWGDGVFRREGGSLVRVKEPLDALVNGIASDAASNVWVATRRELAALGSASRARGLTANVTALWPAQDGGMWAGTADGSLHRLREGRLESFENPRGPGHAQILALYEDRESSLWIAGTEGLRRFKPGPFTTYSTDEGLVHNGAVAVLEARDGAVWVFSDGGGLSRIEDGAVTHLTEKHGLPSNYGGPLFEGRDGALWVGTARGLARVRHGRITSYREGRLSGFVSALFEDQESLVVATTAGGLAKLERFRDGRLYPYRVPGLEIPPHGYVYQARRAPDGTLWLATTVGLFRVRDGRARVFGGVNGLPSDNVRTVHEDADGALWLATADGGAARLKDESIRLITTREGLPDDRIYCVLPGEDGHLWMSSRGGLSRISREDVDRLAAGQIDRVRAVSFDVADGLPTAEFPHGAQQPCWKSRDGRLWFPTSQGVVSVDTRYRARGPLPPPAVIESVRVDGRETRAGETVRVAAGARRVEFLFTGLSLLVPHRVRFKYRLSGWDADWIEESRRSAGYTDLPPGRYRFEVTASNSDAAWNESAARVDVDVRPFFHQTGAFRVLVVVATLLVALGAYRRRLAGLRQRYQAVIDERARIAREMHDTLAQNISGVALMLDSIELPAEAPGKAAGRLREASRLLRYNLAEAYRTIRDLRTDGLEAADFPRAVRRILERATTGQALRYRLSSPVADHALSPDTSEGVLRILQEAVANVVRHAGARSIDVELSVVERRLRLVVADDGRGFDAGRAFSLEAGHYGFIGMRERAEGLGGWLTVESSGEGTRVVVEVPIS